MECSCSTPPLQATPTSYLAWPGSKFWKIFSATETCQHFKYIIWPIVWRHTYSRSSFEKLHIYTFVLLLNTMSIYESMTIQSLEILCSISLVARKKLPITNYSEVQKTNRQDSPNNIKLDDNPFLYILFSIIGIDSQWCSKSSTF